MNKITYRLLTLLLLAGLFSFPLKAQIPHLVFHAELSGSNALPAVNTDAKALVTLLFTPDRTKADVSGMVVKLDGAVISAKIHLGITGEVGPEIFDLTPYINDRHIIGQLDAPAGLLAKLLVNAVYIEVRTTAHPNGEIRGQFECETDQDFGVLLNGNQGVPPTGSNAVAYGGIHFPLGSHDIVYAFVLRGLSGPIDSAGIYEGIPGQGGVKVAKVGGFFGSIIQGLVDLDTVDVNFLQKCRDGKYYVVIFTANYPNGEIIGQVVHLGFFASLSPINGVQQLPPPSPPTQGFGFNHTRISGNLDSLSTNVFINNIQPTSVKVRIGNPTEMGTELVELLPQAVPGFYGRKYPITPSQLTDFAQGRLFVNVTTAAYPNGEIRGVMKNTLRKAYAFDLCGLKMVPPTNSNALGVAVASVDQANCYLNYKIITDGLASVPVDGYVAEGVFGKNGIAFHALANTAPIIAGSHEIMEILGPRIEHDSTYMQIATQGYLGGEIRGQITRGFTCPEVVAVNDLDQVDQIVVSPVPFQDVINVAFESAADFEGRLVMYDIMGVLAKTQTVQIVSGKQTLELRTGNLPKGVYSLSLELPGHDTSILLKKVVKVD